MPHSLRPTAPASPRLRDASQRAWARVRSASLPGRLSRRGQATLLHLRGSAVRVFLRSAVGAALSAAAAVLVSVAGAALLVALAAQVGLTLPAAEHTAPGAATGAGPDAGVHAVSGELADAVTDQDGARMLTAARDLDVLTFGTHVDVVAGGRAVPLLVLLIALLVSGTLTAALVGGLAGRRAARRAGVLGQLSVQMISGQDVGAVKTAGWMAAHDLQLLAAIRSVAVRSDLANRRADGLTSELESVTSGVMELVVAAVEAEERIRAQFVADLHDTVAQEYVVAGYVVADVDQQMSDAYLRTQAAQETVQCLLERAAPTDEAGPGSVNAGASDEQVAELAQAARALGAATSALERSLEEGVPSLRQTVLRGNDLLRAVMAQQRPPELAATDLRAAIRELVQSFRERDGLTVDVDWPALRVDLPLAHAVTAYRYCQESLRNVVKHAGVDRAHLGVAYSPTTGLVLTVTDRGRGIPSRRLASLSGDAAAEDDAFNVRAVSGHHVGLSLLRNRAAMLGCTLEFPPVDGGGTSVRLRVPAAFLRDMGPVPGSGPEGAGTPGPVASARALLDFGRGLRAVPTPRSRPGTARGSRPSGRAVSRPGLVTTGR